MLATRHECVSQSIDFYTPPKGSCLTDGSRVRLFSIASTGECRELDAPCHLQDASALVIVVPTLAAWNQVMKVPLPQTLPRSWFVGKHFFNATTPPLGVYNKAAGDADIAIMAQWETAYLKQARGWKKQCSHIGKVVDFCADKLGQVDVIDSISGAHMVMYFGHAHCLGLNGYHGINVKQFQPKKPLGLFWSWSCNTLIGANSFGLRLLQKGLVKAYVGTTNPKARSHDNRRLAKLSAEVLVREQPTTLLAWVSKLNSAVHAIGDAQLCSAWADYHVLGDITMVLPEFTRHGK